MVVGGIVFRVVTPNYPGDPKLDKAGPVRTEFLANQDEPLGSSGSWTLDADAAFFFSEHANAEGAAKKIGSRCHVSARAPRDEEIPEELKPQQIFPDVPERSSVRRKKKQSRSEFKMDAFRVAQCRRDPVEAL